ncbi:MAG: VWA domain-containing protein, partial [Vicinamibacteria bacterium]|nr:VWA domain-containing protein [Vicinamibacteria bacterium]
MITGIRKIVGLLVLLLAASLAFAVPVNRKPQTPQKGRPQVKAPTPIFTSQVEMVTVDAVVVDKKGRPLTDLRREDFIVYEDDVPQPITSFEAIQVPERPTEKPPAPSRVASNTGQQVRAGRTFAILFDDIHLDHFQARRAQMAVAEFLRVGVRDGDRITLASASGSVYWSTRMLAGREELMTLLKRMEGRLIPDVMAQDRITDYEAMRITEYKDTLIADRVYRRFEASGVLQRQAGSNSSSSSDEETSTDSSNSQSRDGGLGMTDPYISSRALEVYQQATSRNRITLDAIERVVKSLTALKGRKGLILVSQGFIHDPTLFNFKDVIEAARRSNVTLYYVDTRGLSGEMPFFSAEFSGAIDVQDLGPLFADQNQESQGAEYLATESGGFFVKDTNDLGAGITRIADEARAYFLLGYNPPTAAKDGRFHRIQVRCNRKNTTVRARKGYFAPLEGQAKKLKPGEADPEIQQAIDSPFEIEGIPLRLSAYAFEETLIGKSRVVVVADAHIYNLAFEEKEGRLTDSLDMLMVAVHRETG